MGEDRILENTGYIYQYTKSLAMMLGFTQQFAYCPCGRGEDITLKLQCQKLKET